MAQHLLASHHPPLRIDHKPMQPILGVCEAPNCAVRRGGGLAARPVRKRHSVVPRLCNFGLLAERNLYAYLGRLARHRQQKQIAEVGTSRSAQMRLRESVERAIGIAVAAAVVPVEVARVGPRLNESERIRGGGRGVSVRGSADPRIHPLRRIVIPLCAKEHRKRQKRRPNPYQHDIFPIHSAGTI